MGKKFGVDMDRAKIEVMVAACKEQKLEVAKDASPEDLVKLLVQHFRNVIPKENLAKCDCGGVFDAALAACPYCGDVDEESAVEGADAKKEPPKKAKESTPPKAKKEKVSAEAIAEKVLDKMAEAAIVPVGASSDELANLTPKDLDNAVAEIIVLKSTASTSMWELGRKLKDIHERQLWKLRSDDKGKPVYKSFDAFCTAEVQMTATTCYSMIDVADHYTPEQVKELGHTKLMLALKAPEASRKEILQEAKSTSTRALQKKVNKLRAEKGKPKDARAPKGAAAHLPPGKGRASEHITIVQILGRKTIRLFKKPAEKGAPQVPAKRIADQPFGIYELPNGVVMLFAVVADEEGKLSLRIDTKRSKDSQ